MGGGVQWWGESTQAPAVRSYGLVGGALFGAGEGFPEEVTPGLGLRGSEGKAAMRRKVFQCKGME